MSLPGAAGKGGSASRSDLPRSDQTLPRSCRLTSRQQFVAVYERGRRVSTPHFTVFGLVNTTGRARLGITVTRKVGGAVVRNRVKRVVRDIFRRNRHALDAGLDLVVHARPSIVKADARELERAFLGGAKRLARRVRR